MLRLTLLVFLAAAALALPGVASARPSPVTWCGTDEVSADRVPDLEVSDAAQIRVVYAVASDGADRFLAQASGIATDIAWIDQWWQGQDPTRTPRFDRYPFPGCTSTFGDLDLGFVRLPNTQAYYANASDPFTPLVNDLSAALAPSIQQKTLVYYDGPVADPNTCGESQSVASQGGDSGFSIVYLQSSCSNGMAGAGGSSQIAAHELTHDLGAVPDGAPHMCPQQPGHVCDSSSDLLYPYYTDGTDLDSVTLDVNHDDYYAHSGSWWDVQDSRWLEHLPQAPLTVAPQGQGTVKVVLATTLTPPCATGCTLQVDNGTLVAITATPKPGFRFAGWSGSCSGSFACTFRTSGTAAVTALFKALPPKRIAVSITGEGAVRSTPPGLACRLRCVHAFPAASPVSVTAVAAPGWRFVRWTGGGCGAAARCTVRTTASAALHARFARR